MVQLLGQLLGQRPEGEQQRAAKASAAAAAGRCRQASGASSGTGAAGETSAAVSAGSSSGERLEPSGVAVITPYNAGRPPAVPGGGPLAGGGDQHGGCLPGQGEGAGAPAMTPLGSRQDPALV